MVENMPEKMAVVNVKVPCGIWKRMKVVAIESGLSRMEAVAAAFKEFTERRERKNGAAK
jgi:hypothetical protein